LGSSLERLNPSAYGNDPINWRASLAGPSPGLENTANSAPVINAGPDQAVVVATLPVSVLLAGTATDDGLPNPPGKLTLAWSQLSGPGQGAFTSPAQASTTVLCPSIGDYVFRLIGTDGALQGSADVTVSVRPSAPAPFQIDSVDIIPGSPPLLRLRFTAAAGQTYTAQYRSSLTSGNWSKLSDVPAQGASHTAEVTDPIIQGTGARFYRVVSPSQP
jgi:hypothetical protein